MTTQPTGHAERYAAISSRDTRFDGMFFTCVRSTGIFCRPSCPARTPRSTVVEFLPSAAAAVAAGYRACKRCGPMAPPGSPDEDPAASLASRALRLIDEGALDHEGSVPRLAERLAVSERTLHRALVDRTGAGAVAHARIRRARRAHDLVTGSDLPLSQIAHAAGFGSERQFHETFTQIFGHAPSVVRERAGSTERRRAASPVASVLTARLAVRRPFDGAGLAAWFDVRAVPGVEEVEGLVWTRAVHLAHGPGVLRVDLGVSGGPLSLELRLADLRDYASAIGLVRRLLDLDADPEGIDAGLRSAQPGLAPLVTARPGVRIPGTPSLREALMWAVVGQQITTLQARDQVARATDLVGEPLPEALRTGSVVRLPVRATDAAASADEWYRGPAARRAALVGVLGAELEEALPVQELRESLLDLRGIGPWTADYALIRGVRAIDLAPAKDVALLAAARHLGLAEDQAGLMALLATASPWRSYATMHLWHHQAGLPARASSGKDTAP